MQTRRKRFQAKKKSSVVCFRLSSYVTERVASYLFVSVSDHGNYGVPTLRTGSDVDNYDVPRSNGDVAEQPNYDVPRSPSELDHIFVDNAGDAVA